MCIELVLIRRVYPTDKQTNILILLICIEIDNDTTTTTTTTTTTVTTKANHYPNTSHEMYLHRVCFFKNEFLKSQKVVAFHIISSSYNFSIPFLGPTIVVAPNLNQVDEVNSQRCLLTNPHIIQKTIST